MKEILKKKAVWIIAGILAVLVIGIIIGSVAQSVQKKQEYENHVAAAEKYLTELDYEQAIAEYTAALEIEPSNEQIRNFLVNAYLVWANTYIEAGEYEWAIEILERGYAQIADIAIYQKISEVQELVEELKREEQRKFEEEKVQSIANQVLQPLYDFILQNDIEGLIAYLEDKDFEEFYNVYVQSGGNEENKEFLRYSTGTGNDLGFSLDEVIYYGQWEDGRPNGKGWIFELLNGLDAIYVGEVKNGYTEGKGTLVSFKWSQNPCLFEGTFQRGYLYGEIQEKERMLEGDENGARRKEPHFESDLEYLEMDLEGMILSFMPEVQTMNFQFSAHDLGAVEAITIENAPQWLLDIIEREKSEEVPYKGVVDGKVYHGGKTKVIAVAENAEFDLLEWHLPSNCNGFVIDWIFE